jgi:hypothetical protein
VTSGRSGDVPCRTGKVDEVGAFSWVSTVLQMALLVTIAPELRHPTTYLAWAIM